MKMGKLTRRGFIGSSLGLLAACGASNNNSGGGNNTTVLPPVIEEETPTSVNRSFSYIGPNNINLVDEMQTYQSLSDGTTVNVWGFAQTGFNNDRYLPSPVIELIQGQAASINLQSDMPHSIHLHGLDVDQANDGVPLTSGYVSVSQNRDFGQVGTSTRLGPEFTYQFTPNQAGTYIYHCHVDTVLHVEMGMIGTIIVRPPEGNINRAWQGGPFFDKEYIWQLHCLDSSWHQQTVSSGFAVDYQPDYYLINGKDVVDNDPATAISGASGDRILIRAVNIGFLPAKINLADANLQLIASDGRPLRRFVNTNEILVAPGERYDFIYTLGQSTTGRVQYVNITDLNSVVGGVSVPIRV